MDTGNIFIEPEKYESLKDGITGTLPLSLAGIKLSLIKPRGFLKMKNLTIVYVAAGLFLVLIIGCTATQIIGGPITFDLLKDGVYEGKAKGGPVKVFATVTIQKKRLTKITLHEHRTWKGAAAEKVIPDRIIEAQSTKVDAVSGATLSSMVILNAVEKKKKKASK